MRDDAGQGVSDCFMIMYFMPVFFTVSSSSSSSSSDIPAGTALMACFPTFIASVTIQTCNGAGVKTATASSPGCWRNWRKSLYCAAAP